MRSAKERDEDELFLLSLAPALVGKTVNSRSRSFM